MPTPFMDKLDELERMRAENWRMEYLNASRDAASLAGQVNRLREEIEQLRVALKVARSQLVTLGGNPRESSDRDAIHAVVLETIDAALSE